MEVLEHEHPLKLIDLQLEFPDQEEEEEEDDDVEVVKKEGFSEIACGRCGQVISMYHRYYYTCSSCHYSLHKFCAELSTSLERACHPHPLTQKLLSFRLTCHFCGNKHKRGELSYSCTQSQCAFWIDVNCVVEAGKKTIHHPCHIHPLICAISEPILCKCKACGKKHEGIFFHCTTCSNFTIHSECAFLPETLLIQDATDNAFHHTHPLTISYSFPMSDQRDKYYPKCRVCPKRFESYLWIYKCDKCMYYAHLDCATSRREPFMSILLAGKTIKNYKDVDHPDLLHLPFPDETYSIPKRLFFQELSGTSHDDHKVNLEHMSHQHPLTLVDQTQCNEQTSSWLLKYCHNPMKKIQLLCNGCLRPITSAMPFYKCAETCDFALHEWCTRLPPKIENHSGHPQHTLLLKYSNDLPFFFGMFECQVCQLQCNGFAYCCVECGYYSVDVGCGFIPKQITHKTHTDHLLSLVQNKHILRFCHICGNYMKVGRLAFCCNKCGIVIHPVCALLLPEAVRHKYDKHTMHISYQPIENHKSHYFCEICEEDLNPHRPFYHCKGCVQSVHTACAPLILQCETETNSYNKGWGWDVNVYYYVNIKFGGIHKAHSHPDHLLSFAQGIESHGRCSMCGESLQYKLIFKCLECEFAVHFKCV